MRGTGWRRLVGVALVLGVAVGAWGALPDGAAEEKKEAAKAGGLPDDLSRAPAKGMLMVSLRPAELWNSELGKGMRDKMGKDVAALTGAIKGEVGLAPADVERLTIVLRDPGARAPLVLVRAVKKADRKAVVAAAVPGAKAEKYGQHELHVGSRKALVFLSETAYAIADKEGLEALVDTKPGTETGGLVPGYALAAKKHSLSVAVSPAAFPPLPDEVPAELEPYVPLTKASLGTFTADVGEKNTGKLRVTFQTDEEAKAGVKGIEEGQKQLLGHLQGLIKQLGQDKKAAGVVAFLKLVEGSVSKAKPAQKGKELTADMELKLDPKVAGQVGVEIVGRIRDAARRMKSSNNLKQIGLAMHSYLDANRSFPPAAIYDKNGKALLSWRVLILPYIEQDDLYKQFKLDEPWDSKHNKKLLEKMPPVYVSPDVKTKNKYGTFYQGFAGKGAFFDGKTGIAITDISDGTSNTIMVAESATDVPWTKPEDMPFDPDKALPKLGGITPGSFQALFGDGSVRNLPLKLKKDTLKALITIAGGEVIGDDF
jgi:Protein of unknown function (DUF1559)